MKWSLWRCFFTRSLLCSIFNEFFCCYGHFSVFGPCSMQWLWEGRSGSGHRFLQRSKELERMEIGLPEVKQGLLQVELGNSMDLALQISSDQASGDLASVSAFHNLGVMLRIQYYPLSHHWITLLLNWFGVEDLRLYLLLILSVSNVLLATWLLSKLQ